MRDLTTANGEIRWIIGFVVAIWLIFFIDLVLPLEQFGLVPRHLSGLFGIVTMPFLHGSWQHLLSNTVPLVVLLCLLAGSRANSLQIVVIISLVGALLLWLIGRPALHIGASLLVFGLASFLVASGLIEKRPISLAISILILFIYGASLVKGLLPINSGVSWEGHLSGLIGGVLAAFLLNPRHSQAKSR